MILPLAMREALNQAKAAALRGEVPVGAVVVGADGLIAAKAGNETIALNDPTAHAEILAIRRACARIGSARLCNHDLFVTLEPCAMCAAAISFARFRRLYYAAADPKMGAVEHGGRFFSQRACHHRPEIYSGIGGEKASALLKRFFADRR